MTRNKDWIKLENNTFIHKSAIIYENVIIGANCVIGEYTIIGRNNIDLFTKQNSETDYTIIGNNSYIDSYSRISLGAKIGNNVMIGPYCFIGRYSAIGDGTKCHYHAQIYENVVIGENCKIGGFCCNDVVVGDNANIYGNLVHKFLKRNDSKKCAPKIGADVTIGIGSVVVDGVKIGDSAYIAANSVITKDVLPFSRARNINELF